ncbi:urea transporter [Singulisphaera acidiphila]|uniref:Urea transporter n=1 Tax=Singulisphaera acidiphila (strain ATCC BAA-1392 / DSM 18658 / VKM B-2454 / MOB10) TaxID=886293 RepID=L0DAH8_SINAD|nr:urea transporter [Singulisphaera acidiphila]AGA25671.1 urea transporter [Singulisphaera acidiphila DSM 18658]
MLSLSDDVVPTPIRTVLRGVGQVYFQANALTGAVLVTGIALSSPLMAMGAVVGSAIGTATARLCKFQEAEVAEGLYGFNSMLVGIATFFYFRLSPVSLALLTVGGVMATLVTRLLNRSLPFPVFNSPYVITTWSLYVLGPILGAVWVGPGDRPIAYGFVEAVAHGVGQALFQANLWTGILCLVGIALNDWRHAAWALVGAMIGIMVANYHVTPGMRALDPERLIERAFSDNLALGLYSYNATLPAVALFRWRRSLIPPLLGILISVPLTELVPKLGLPALTAPFVLATWFVLGLGLLEGRYLRNSAPTVP